MHPLVRDLYKRALHVGKDYPAGLARVRELWKKALRNPDNCPACYSTTQSSSKECEEQIVHAVARGRQVVREMIGVIQLKKYRTIRQRYNSNHLSIHLREAMDELEKDYK